MLAKINEEFLLCHKLSGLNEANCSCINAHKDGCYRALEASEYNERVAHAIEKYSLLNKNALIIDKGREVGERSAVLIKNGMFKGIGFYNLNHQINNIHILESIITPMKGDMNTNHIIESYLRKRKVLKIMELDQ